MNQDSHVSECRVGLLIASLSAGGAEKVALNLFRNLLEAGIDTYLMTLDRNLDLIASDPTHGMDKSSRSRCIPLSRADIRWSTLAKVLFFPWQWVALQRTVRQLDLEVVVSLMERSNIANLLSPAAPVRIVSVHSYPTTMLASKSPLKRILIRSAYPWLMKRAHRIVFVSREARHDFHTIFPVRDEQTEVIQNACDIDDVRARAAEPLADEHLKLFRHRVVLTHGRLISDKGHWHLIRSFAHLSATVEGLHLVILGEGPTKADLQALCRTLGIERRVTLGGFQANPMPWLRRADLFVLPSLREGLPGALLEAMALGKPIVASDCRSGPRELLAPETDPGNKTKGIEETACGLLTVPPSRDRVVPEAALSREELLLAEAMARMLENPVLRERCARGARRRVDDFSPERITMQWQHLIEELLPIARAKQ